MTLALACSLALVAGLVSSAGGSDPRFSGTSVTRAGTIVLDGPVARVFPLFGPVDEKLWAEGWDPKIIHPAGEKIAAGMVFVSGDHGETTWIVSEYDPAAHAVTYRNFTPGYQVRTITIRCREISPGATEATVAYTYVGLSERGNREAEEMTEDAYRKKMEDWTRAINQYLNTGRTLPHH